MTYGNVYVATVAFGANPAQTVRAFIEAEAYDGPSIIIAYSHCIAHGINMTSGVEQHKKAVTSGHWTLCRYNPDLIDEGKNPLQIDCKEPTTTFTDYAYSENRYKALKGLNAEQAARLMAEAEEATKFRANLYRQMAKMDFSKKEGGEEEKEEK
jgi:pyruvate-ferredoxin/flavodoxin oxidoreductase